MTGARMLAAVALSAVLLGCGLKGPLELPPKSTNVIVRGPQAPATGESPAPAEDDDSLPPDERLPPPPLPDGNPGGSSGD